MKNWFKKSAIKAVLYFAIVPYYIITVNVAAECYLAIIKKFFIPGSYIASIETTSYHKEDIQAALQEFNYMGHGKIVSYEKNRRPIYIMDSDFKYDIPSRLMGYETLGLTTPLPGACYIRLKKKMPIQMLNDVLIHEYLHCMGYEHVKNNPSDLMYPSYNENVDIINIINYGRDLEKRFDGK